MSSDSQPVATVLFGVLEVTTESAVKVALAREGTCVWGGGGYSSSCRYLRQTLAFAH